MHHGSVCCPINGHWKMPLGYNYREKYMQTLQKSVIKHKIHRSIKANGLLTPLQRGGLE
jgi:hypothetical protein